MNKDVIKELIYILMAVLIGIVAVKFIIWLLPVILIAIVAYLVYRSIKKNKNIDKYVSKNTKNNIKVIHDLDDED